MTVGDEEFQERSTGVIRDFLSQGRTVIMASHDIPAITALSDRLARLEQGRIVQIGEPAQVAEEYLAAIHAADAHRPA